MGCGCISANGKDKRLDRPGGGHQAPVRKEQAPPVAVHRIEESAGETSALSVKQAASSASPEEPMSAADRDELISRK